MQAITSGSLAALSDITAQKLVSNAPLNWRRTVAMALFGLIWSGPSNHYWQKFTNQLFRGKKDAASVAQKVCTSVPLASAAVLPAEQRRHVLSYTIVLPLTLCILCWQVLIDNLVYSPVFNLLVMAYISTVVEGKGFITLSTAAMATCFCFLFLNATCLQGAL